MRDTKYCIESVMPFDFRGVEKRLEAMAAKGWRLERAGRYFWKYRRAEPAKIHYAVTYSLDASDFNPGPTEGQLSLEELCAGAGWKKVSDWAQMQIYVSEQENPVPLETDETLRLEVIGKAMRKAYLPASVLMIILGVLYWLPQVVLLIWNPVRFFENGTGMVVIAAWLSVTAAHGYNLWNYCRWRRQSLQSAAHGGPCAEAGPYQMVNWILLVFIFLIMAGFLLGAMRRSGWNVILAVFVYVILFLLTLLLIEQARKALRRMGASKGTNIGVSVVLGSIIGGVVLVAITFGLLRDVRLSSEEKEFPLTLEELNGVSYTDTQQTSFPLGMGSFLLTRHFYADAGTRITPEGERIEESIRYEIEDVKTEWLYNKVLERYMEPEEVESLRRVWKPVPSAPWGAEKVYHFYLNNKATNSYLLCWPGRLADLEFDAPPTAEQMASAGRALAPEP